MKSPVQLFIAVAILLATATVAAQVYKWVDKDGKVQYTDTPPPASATKTEAKKVDTSPAAASTAGTPAKSLQDRAKDFDKRKADDAEKAKKSEADQQAAAANAANCRDARAALKDLETGRPLTRNTDSGNREILDEESRQTETAKARKSVADFCK
ncbi:MAG: DUF4124 domain-containing protein [Burkholderiales bacterium]|nr:DUF4124 domain-containing protein [Burkholderiales bacterium]